MATATYPPPPPYYRLYKDYIQNPKSAPEPPPPIEGTYALFGATYTVRFRPLSLSLSLGISLYVLPLFGYRETEESERKETFASYV